MYKHVRSLYNADFHVKFHDIENNVFISLILLKYFIMQLYLGSFPLIEHLARNNLIWKGGCSFIILRSVRSLFVHSKFHDKESGLFNNDVIKYQSWLALKPQRRYILLNVTQPKFIFILFPQDATTGALSL